MIVQLDKINKGFLRHGEVHMVLESLQLFIASGESVAIMGSGGSGKTSLLKIIGLMDSGFLEISF